MVRSLNLSNLSSTIGHCPNYSLKLWKISEPIACHQLVCRPNSTVRATSCFSILENENQTGTKYVEKAEKKQLCVKSTLAFVMYIFSQDIVNIVKYLNASPSKTQTEQINVNCVKLVKRSFHWMETPCVRFNRPQNVYFIGDLLSFCVFISSFVLISFYITHTCTSNLFSYFIFFTFLPLFLFRFQHSSLLLLERTSKMRINFSVFYGNFLECSNVSRTWKRINKIHDILISFRHLLTKNYKRLILENLWASSTRSTLL